jgi:hypothetical protein
MISQSFSNFSRIWTKKEILIVPRLTLTMVTEQWVQWTCKLPREHWLVNSLTGLWLGHGGWLGAARRRRSPESASQASPGCVVGGVLIRTSQRTKWQWLQTELVTGASPATANSGGELQPTCNRKLRATKRGIWNT